MHCAGTVAEQLIGTDFTAFISVKLDPVAFWNEIVSGGYRPTEIDFVADYAGSSVDLSTATFMEVATFDDVPDWRGGEGGGDWVSFRTIDFSRVEPDSIGYRGAVEHWLWAYLPFETFARLDDPIDVLSNPAVYSNPESWAYSVCVLGEIDPCALGRATSLQMAIVPVPASLGFVLVAIPGLGSFIRRH